MFPLRLKIRNSQASDPDALLHFHDIPAEGKTHLTKLKCQQIVEMEQSSNWKNGNKLECGMITRVDAKGQCRKIEDG